MEIRQVYYFLEVAKYSNFSKAAKSLYISQPTISQQINALESELQIKLFNRTPHGISLTEEGEKFRKYGQKIADAVDDLLVAFGQSEKGKKKILNIGLFPFYKTAGLAQEINYFFSTNANVLGNIKVLENYQCFKLLKNSHLDFAIIKAEECNLPPYIDYVKLLDEPLHVIISRKNPFAQKKELSVKDLAHLPLLTGEINSSLYDYMKNIYEKNNIEPHIAFYNTKEIDVLTDMICDDIGITFATEHVGNCLSNEKITSLPIVPEKILSTFLIYGKNKKLRGMEISFRDHFIDFYKKKYISLTK